MSKEKTQPALAGEIQEAAKLFQEAVGTLHEFNTKWAEGKLQHTKKIKFAVSGSGEPYSEYDFKIISSDLGFILPVLAQRLRVRVEKAEVKLNKAMAAYNESKKK